MGCLGAGCLRLLEVNRVMSDIVERLREFVDAEARSCSMDYGCITPVYVYRMWDGSVAIEEIANTKSALRQVLEPVRKMM